MVKTQFIDVIIILNNKIQMSQQEIDRILSKYEKKQPAISYKFELQSTKRKPESKKKNYQEHFVTFMNESQTPSKQINAAYGFTERVNSPIKHDSQSKATLKYLDETERKLAVSEKNYAEMCRKFQKIKAYSCELQAQLQKQRKSRLQQLIDLQNTLRLLQGQNRKNLSLLETKQDTIVILNQKIKQKDVEIGQFEQEIEQISYRLHNTIKLRQQEKDIANLQYKKQQQNLSISMLLKLKESHQKQIKIMKQQLEKYSKVFKSKQKEKRQLLEKIQSMSQQHLKQISQLRKDLLQNEENYRKWLADLKTQKLSQMENYEAQIRKITKRQYTDGLELTEHNYHQDYDTLREFQDKIKQLQIIIHQKQGIISNLSEQTQEDNRRISTLTLKLNRIKQEYVDQMKETKKYMGELQIQEQLSKRQKSDNTKYSVELETMKAEIAVLSQQILSIRTQNQELLHERNRLIKNIGTNNSNESMEMNKNLSQVTIKQQKHIVQLEQQIENLTKDLYAQRLENASLNEQIESTKKQLKKQYQTSVQNVKLQLKEQIKQQKENSLKRGQELDKQKLYLEMFSLERKYELLKSETITVQEMARMNSKLDRFHQKTKR